MQVRTIAILAILAIIIGALGVWALAQIDGFDDGSPQPAFRHSLAQIAGAYSYAPELCDDPDTVIEITEQAVHFDKASTAEDIHFCEIDFRLLNLPLTGATPTIVGAWRTSNAEIRTSLFLTLSDSDLQHLKLPPSQSTSRNVLSYTVYDFDALNKLDTFAEWAPNLIEGYALYPCDHDGHKP